jgi:hypothetical protein
MCHLLVQGFKYITSVEECEAAATHLYMANFEEVTVRTVRERCSNTNLITGNQRDNNISFVCEHIMANQGGSCWNMGTTFGNPDGGNTLSIDCLGTCAQCGKDGDRFCSRGTGSAQEAPLGYCVLIEHSQPPARFEAGATARVDSSNKMPDRRQELMFFDECTANYFNREDTNYRAICKVQECLVNEQVRGLGAAKVSPGTMPSESDDAECEPNTKLLGLKAEVAKEQYQIVVYGIVAIGLVIYVMVVCVWCRPSLSPNYERYAAEWDQTSTPSVPPTRWFRRFWESRRFEDFLQASYAWFKIADLMSDWGFLIISVRSLNFQYSVRFSDSILGSGGGQVDSMLGSLKKVSQHAIQ